MGQYNWGSLVYQYLVSSLCNASIAFKNEKSTTHMHIVGCVYILQVNHVYLLKCKLFMLGLVYVLVFGF